jgi:hypothetical protein
MECSGCKITTKFARPVNGGILCTSCHKLFIKDNKIEQIMDILNSHERTTYPRGVGSVFRCIESHNYRSIAEQLLILTTK